MTFGRRASAAAALVAYIAVAAAIFSSTWVHPSTWSIGEHAADTQQMKWFLGWPPFAMTHADNLIFTNFLDYPGGVNLMWNTSVILPAVVLAPLTQLAGSVFAYNVLMSIAPALSAWTGYLFIRRFVSGQVAAGVGGALYGFSPFVIAHSTAHPQLTVALIPPILLLLLDEIVRVQRRRPLVSGLLLGLAAAAQVLIGEEVLAITAFVGFLLLCIAVALCPDHVRSHARHAMLGLGTAAAVFAVLAAVPVGFQFLGPQHVSGGAVHAPNFYVSDALSFFVPSRFFLVSPSGATAIAARFSGNVVEDNSYVGVLLSLLLAFIVVRYWGRLEVRLAALGAVLIAILSMGITIHLAGRVIPIPVFALGLVFPLLQRYLPGRLMLYLTFFGWLALSRLPVLSNILPNRLMLMFYLLAGVLIAVWLDEMRAWQPRPRRLGWVAAAASLLLLAPVLPFPTEPVAIPAFFDGGAVSRIPTGSVVLVIPFSAHADARAMTWQERAGMRFRMPEGYAFIPDPQLGVRLSPPVSATQTQSILVAIGRGSPLTDTTRDQILRELKSWHVQTVVVGPMNNEQQEVDLFTSVLGRAPELVDGVYVWWGVDAQP